MHASSASLCSLLAGCQLVSWVLVCMLGRLPNASLLYSGFTLFSGVLPISSAVQPMSLYATGYPPPHCSQVDPPYFVCPFSLTSIPPYFLQASVFQSPLHMRFWCLPFLAPSFPTPRIPPPPPPPPTPSPGRVCGALPWPHLPFLWSACNPDQNPSSDVRPSSVYGGPPMVLSPRRENWTFAEAPFPGLSLPSLLVYDPPRLLVSSMPLASTINYPRPPPPPLQSRPPSKRCRHFHCHFLPTSLTSPSTHYFTLCPLPLHHL